MNRSGPLTADEAMRSLCRFCKTCDVSYTADDEPIFSFKKNSRGLLRGTVFLPGEEVPSELRRIQGRRWWRTEFAAKQETVLRAYDTLRCSNLIAGRVDTLHERLEPRLTRNILSPCSLRSSQQYDPWEYLAHSWSTPDLHSSRLKFSMDGILLEHLSVAMILPRLTVVPDTMLLHRNSEKPLRLTFDAPTPVLGRSEEIEQLREMTILYLRAPSTQQYGLEQDFVTLFAPDLSPGKWRDWLHQYAGRKEALDIYHGNYSAPSMGIIRDRSKFSEPRLFKRWVIPDEQKGNIQIECESMPHRGSWFQLRASDITAQKVAMKKPKMHVLPAAACTVDRLPAMKAMFGLFIPAILERLGATLTAHALNETLLKPVGFEQLCHVLIAITAPSVRASINYQRYEFIGDAVLKFTVSCQLFYSNPSWKEGHLSGRRDELIGNNRLALAALETGLDRFILTRSFSVRKWAVPLVSRYRNTAEPTAERMLSSKVLADVVEALVGAAYKDGGISRAKACVQRFLPEMPLLPFELPCTTYSTCDSGDNQSADHHHLACLIGYNFNNPALLKEAFVHPSCKHDKLLQSYQRLEFLGDAVLDMIVVSIISEYSNQLSQGRMTVIKHAVVNGKFLAFLCMDFSVPSGGEYDSTITSSGSISLWHFLHFDGLEIKVSIDGCLQRFQSLRQELGDHLKSATDYPWGLLTRLRPNKVFSDVVESVLGAIFVDSAGSLSLCSAFLERIGLMHCLRRIIVEEVGVAHPCNQI